MQENPNTAPQLPPKPLASQPPAAMPKPIVQAGPGSPNSAGTETLSQSSLAEMLKKADQVRPAAPSEHPPIDITASKPGNVISPSGKVAQLPSLPAKPLASPMPAGTLSDVTAAQPSSVPSTPTRPPISAFMAPDIRKLSAPPKPASQPAELPAAPPPKQAFIVDSIDQPTPADKPAQSTPITKPSKPIGESLKQLMFGVEHVLAKLRRRGSPANRLRQTSSSTILLAVLAVCLLLVAVPKSRYAAAGLFIKKSLAVSVYDSTTGSPVSYAHVTSEGKVATTDASGLAIIDGLRPGKHQVSVSKAYYGQQDQTEQVSLLGHSSPQVSLHSTGNLVSVSLKNIVTGQPAAGAFIKAGSAQAVASADGKALLAVAPGSAFQPADVSLAGYNDLHTTLSVTEGSLSSLTTKLTPTGRAYFLSRHGSSLEVVSSLLDGTGRKYLLKQSGFEGPEAELIPSPDHKYLALRARRTADPHAELYLINTETGGVREIAFGQGQFTMYGWLGSHLIYAVTYDDLRPWQGGLSVLSSYDAVAGKAAAIFRSQAAGNANAWAHQSLALVMLVGGSVIYGVNWQTDPSALDSLLAKHDNSLNVAFGDGTNNQVAASVNAATYRLDYKQNGPASLYLRRVSLGGGADHYYSYRFGDSQPTPVLIKASQFDQIYPRYFFSPDDSQVLWAQTSASGNNLLIGDNMGQNPVKILADSPYAPQGWYSDQYLLVHVGSKLYIMATSGGTPLKIDDGYVSY